MEKKSPDPLPDPMGIKMKKSRSPKAEGMLLRDWLMVYVAWRTEQGRAPCKTKEIAAAANSWKLKHGGTESKMSSQFHGYKGVFYGAKQSHKDKFKQSFTGVVPASVRGLWADMIEWTKEGITAKPEGLKEARRLLAGEQPSRRVMLSTLQKTLIDVVKTFPAGWTNAEHLDLMRKAMTPKMAASTIMHVVNHSNYADIAGAVMVTFDAIYAKRDATELIVNLQIDGYEKRDLLEAFWSLGLLPLPGGLPVGPRAVLKAWFNESLGGPERPVEGRIVRSKRTEGTWYEYVPSDRLTVEYDTPVESHTTDREFEGVVHHYTTPTWVGNVRTEQERATYSLLADDVGLYSPNHTLAGLYRLYDVSRPLFDVAFTRMGLKALCWTYHW